MSILPFADSEAVQSMTRLTNRVPPYYDAVAMPTHDDGSAQKHRFSPVGLAFE